MEGGGAYSNINLYRTKDYINSLIRASVSVRLIINFCIIIRVDRVHCLKTIRNFQTSELKEKKKNCSK